jgi:hypothetical protein
LHQLVRKKKAQENQSTTCCGRWVLQRYSSENL